MARPELELPGNVRPIGPFAGPGAEPRPDAHFIGEPELPEVMGFHDYWRAIREYKWSVLLIAALAAVLGMLSALSAEPVFRSEARVLVKFDQAQMAMVQNPDAYSLHWMFYETQYDIIRSRAIAEKVVQRLGLANPELSRANQAETAPPPAWAKVWANWRDVLAGWWQQAQSWSGMGPEEARNTPPIYTPAEVERTRAIESAVTAITSGLEVHGGEQSEVIQISYESNDAEHTADVVNAITQAYIEFGLESQLSSTRQANTWLQSRVSELRAQVDTAERRLREYQNQAGMVDSQSRETMLGARLGSLSTALIKAQSRRSQTEARYRQAADALARGENYPSLMTMLDSALVVDSHRTLTRLERDTSELSQRYGEKHPKMIAARTRVLDAKSQLDAEVTKAVGRLRKDFEVARAEEGELRRMIGAQKSEMRVLSAKASGLARLEREVTASRELYEAFRARHKEVDVAESYDVTSVRVLDEARPGLAPISPNRPLIVIAFVGIGLLLGIAIACAREFFDKSIRTGEDIEARLHLPVLGVVPQVETSLFRRPFIVRHHRDAPQSGFAEAINDVRTAVLFSGVDDPAKTVLVTSSTAGEGKTTLASNLALAFAQRGRTLLLECDLRRGQLTEAMGLGDVPGLTDVVTGQIHLKEAVLADSDVENLFVLGAGTVPPNPLEILSSKRFAAALANMRRSFDHIVLDGAPLLPVSDSVVLSRQVDAVVFCVQTDRINYESARDALKRLYSVRVQPLGAVLQQVDLRRLRRYAGRYRDQYVGYYGYHRS